MRYAHTNIIARDWQALADFYCQALDCRPVGGPICRRGPWVDALTGLAGAEFSGCLLALPGWPEDGPRLEIFSFATTGAPQPRPLDGCGLGHLAFVVEDVAQSLGRIVALGGRAVGAIAHPDYPGAPAADFVYAADPEGNIIELQHFHL